jgi:aminopeptidase N
MADRSLAAQPQAVRLEEYRVPDFRVDTVDLVFRLDPVATNVRCRMGLRRNPEGVAGAPLHLDGGDLVLGEVRLDEEVIGPDRYRLASGALLIDDLPDAFDLEIETTIAPAQNTELSGLYVSGGNFFTQCEAEGFRRITYFPDRPDVMARFTTTIVAPKTCPVLLSNGNLIDQGSAEGGLHWAKWEDPHPKPCYLFALVAGDLVSVADRFTTASGREVALAIWVRHGDHDKCEHAMRSLKTSMRWDETVFGLEYDLDVFNIAAVSDFNMGAMENKGLNVFNTKYVLAKPDTATDGDYQGIETVIAHEYFHNWTGNRVTCRDWFQLSLKEGLTVFRDQEFSADQGSRAVKRIGDVRRLRASQFPEDAGPLAHPVRPQTYLKIDNFYTATVYQKGAEVVRMIHTLIGAEKFRAGMDLYVARHDNQAVTIEDFVAAMEDASAVDLGHFRRWYEQAGTPTVSVSDHYDPATQTYRITLAQNTPPTPGQADKAPFLIPIKLGLLDGQGREIPLHLQGEGAPLGMSTVLRLSEPEESFVFVGVPELPVPSVLRGFSAPVILKGISRDRLQYLAANDVDPFVRWESGQQYATGLLLEGIETTIAGGSWQPEAGLIASAASVLATAATDPAFAAEALALPSEAGLADRMQVIDVDAIHTVREQARVAIGRALASAFRTMYDRLEDPGPYRIDGASIGRRALRSMCLYYLVAAGEGVDLAVAAFDAQSNMTDVLTALSLLSSVETPARQAALDRFHQAWRHEDLVLDKWFAIQAMSSLPDTLARVVALSQHPDFDLRNPNRMRALVASFATANPARFHAASGGGYRFLADTLLKVDGFNSQVAARLVSAFGTWRRHEAVRQSLMHRELERIHATPGLSRATFELVSKTLG